MTSAVAELLQDAVEIKESARLRMENIRLKHEVSHYRDLARALAGQWRCRVCGDVFKPVCEDCHAHSCEVCGKPLPRGERQQIGGCWYCMAHGPQDKSMKEV